MRSKLSRRSSAVSVAKPPSFSISVSPPQPAAAAAEAFCGLDATGTPQPFLTPGQPSPLSTSSSPWPRTPSEEVAGVLGAWPGFDAAGRPPLLPFSSQYAWSTDPNLFLSHLLSCDERCKQHSPQVHDASRTLSSYHAVSSQWSGGGGGGRGGGGWSPEANNNNNNNNNNTNNMAWGMAQQGMSPGGGSRIVPWGASSSPVLPEINQLHRPRRLQDSELFAICKLSFNLFFFFEVEPLFPVC